MPDKSAETVRVEPEVIWEGVDPWGHRARVVWCDGEVMPQEYVGGIWRECDWGDVSIEKLVKHLASK